MDIIIVFFILFGFGYLLFFSEAEFSTRRDDDLRLDEIFLFEICVRIELEVEITRIAGGKALCDCSEEDCLNHRVGTLVAVLGIALALERGLDLH